MPIPGIKRTGHIWIFPSNWLMQLNAYMCHQPQSDHLTNSACRLDWSRFVPEVIGKSGFESWITFWVWRSLHSPSALIPTCHILTTFQCNCKTLFKKLFDTLCTSHSKHFSHTYYNIFWNYPIAGPYRAEMLIVDCADDCFTLLILLAWQLLFHSGKVCRNC